MLGSGLPPAPNIYYRADFFMIMKAKSSAEGKRQLADWLFSVEAMDIPEFFDCTRASRHWFQAILNAMDCPWNNGYTEGCNHKTKVLKRACYGVRNY